MGDSLGEQISVCLITYNHVGVIESTIRSVLEQSVSDYEIIISDDCSTDGTWESIQALAEADSRIVALQTPTNLGMPGNANFALAHSARPYVALLHHDDLYDYHLLAKWGAVLDEHPDVAFVFNPYRVDGANQIESRPMPGTVLDGSWLLENYLFRNWDCVIRGTAMIRRAAWEEIGGMRERFSLFADIDVWMRLAMRWKVGYVSDPLITTRHQRPSYYPEIYQGTKWSWIRQRLVYEIHAANRRDYYGTDGVRAAFQWARFRTSLTLETLKWLCYAAVRGKREMLWSSSDSATPYDLPPLRAFRWIVKQATRSDARPGV